MRTGFAFILGLVVTVAGCGGGGSTIEKLSVSGKVTYDGKPVEEGTINFNDSKTGQAGGAELGSGGNFSVTIPTGTYKVTVRPPQIEKPSPDGNSPPSLEEKKVDNIPAEVRAESTTPLSITVDGSKRSFDLELKK